MRPKPKGWFKDRPAHSDWLDHLRERNLLPAQPDYAAWKREELALYTEWPEETPDELWALPDGRTLRLVRMRDPHGGISLLFSDMTDSMTLKSQASLPLYHDTDFWDSLKARATDPNPDVRRHVDGEIKRSDDKMLTWLSRPLPDGATLVAWDDVTSARRAEAALIERAEALEEADRMKSEFVGHVSYQLRKKISASSELMKRA